MKLFQDIRNKFSPALNGIRFAWLDKSVVKQMFIALIVIIVTLFLNFSILEWLFVITACGLIITLEIINSIIEKIVDVHYESYHDVAMQIKDMAAAFVLIMSMAVAIGYILILIGKFI